MVAALIPNPVSRSASAASSTTWLRVLRRFVEGQVEVVLVDLEPDDVLLEQALGFEQQLLAGLVPVQHDHG